jgi:hypothetical protein
MLVALLAQTYSDQIFLQFYYGIRSAQDTLRESGVEVGLCLFDINYLPQSIDYLCDDSELFRIAARDECNGVITLGSVLYEESLPRFLSTTFPERTASTSW